MKPFELSSLAVASTLDRDHPALFYSLIALSLVAGVVWAFFQKR